MTKSKRYKFSGIGLTTKERRRAKKLFNDYKKLHNYEKLNDLELLESLIFTEILIERTKDAIENLGQTDNKKVADIIPKKHLEQLETLENRALTLRDKLGLFEEKQKNDPLEYIKTLEKKFKIWRDANQLSRQVTCPFCSKLFFLNIRTDKYKPSKTAYFHDKILVNVPLWKLYKEKKITKKDVANVLGVSPDYVDWMEKYIKEHPDINPSTKN